MLLVYFIIFIYFLLMLLTGVYFYVPEVLLHAVGQNVFLGLVVVMVVIEATLSFRSPIRYFRKT